MIQRKPLCHVVNYCNVVMSLFGGLFALFSVFPIVRQALPEAERRTAEAIGNGTGIDDNAAVEAIKAERQHANQVRGSLASRRRSASTAGASAHNSETRASVSRLSCFYCFFVFSSILVSTAIVSAML